MTSEKAPFFSVIIPTYNRAKAILEATGSVLNQSFVDFELLVIDDGSTDNTKELVTEIAKKDERLIYIYQNNAERSAARNCGINLSKGKYICFLDSDDIYLPNHLQLFYKTIEKHKYEKAFFIGNALSEIKGKHIKAPPYVTETDDPMERIIKTAICSQLTCLHKDILLEHQFNKNIRIGEDQELWSRVVAHYPIILSDQYTVVIRDLGDRTIDYLNADTYRANLKVIRQIVKNDSERRIRLEWRRFALSAAYYKLAVSYLKQNRSFHFYENILRSILISPTHFFKDKLLVIGTTIPFLKGYAKSRLPNF